MAYSTTTRTTLRSRIRERIIEDFWSDTELNLYIDEALMVWNLMTGYHRQSTTVSIPGSTVFYDLRTITDFEIFLRAELADHHLINISVRELDKMNRKWMCDDAAPIYVAPVGLTHCIFYPVSLTAFDVTIEHIRTAPLPTTDADYIQVSEEDMPAIVDYVHFLCTLKEGGAELAVGSEILKVFMQHAASHNSKLNNISVFRKMLGYGGQNETRPTPTETQFPRMPKQ